jgi:phosphoribosylanthranilate isomerase
MSNNSNKYQTVSEAGALHSKSPWGGFRGLRIKICCISSIEEAKLAIAQGASALGLVGPMPSGPGIITDELIFEIAKTVPPPVGTFLLTSETKAEDIIAHHAKVLTNTIQIVDALSEGTYQQIKTALPAVKLVQVIHVIDEASIEEAIRISEEVDVLLLDSGNPNLSVKVLGGTGNTHNWKLSRQIVEQSKVPVFLAGGLKVENVKQAIEEVEPFGLDLCSSVRTDKKLDAKKLDAFFRAAWG